MGLMGGRDARATRLSTEAWPAADHVHRHFSLRPGQGSVGCGSTESMVASDTGLPTRREAVERLALQRGVWHGAIQNRLERGVRARCVRARCVRARCVRMFGCVTTRCTGKFGVGGTIPTGVSRCWAAYGPEARPRSTRRAKELPNKEMKLTSVERIERSQLISGVRPTSGESEAKRRTAGPWLS
jgi:hypothetical protein